MRIATIGKPVPKELLRAVRNAGHTVIRPSETSPDAIILNSSDKIHLNQSRKLLSAGTPLFYGQPGRQTPDQQKLLQTAQDSKTPFYIPYRRRISPAYASLTQQVKSGAIGTVGFIKIHSNLRVPRAYVAGKARSCASVILNEMTHDIDWIESEFGPIRNVFCQGVQKPKPVTEYAMATFTLKGGVIAQVIHSYQSKVEPSLRVEVCGKEGILQYDSQDIPIRQSPKSNRREISLDGNSNYWSQQWSVFEALVNQRRQSKKQMTSLIKPIDIAELTIQSVLSNEPRQVN